MASDLWIIFPHQLHAPRTHLPAPASTRLIVFVEHPLFFGSPKRVPRFHYQKLVMHRASMKAYEAECKEAGHEVFYIEYAEAKKPANWLAARLPAASLQKAPATVTAWNPTDHLLQKETERLVQKTWGKKTPLTWLDSPLFLTTRAELDSYHTSLKAKKTVSYSQAAFYKWQVARLDLDDVIKKSYDVENRRRLPATGLVIPEHREAIDSETEWVREAEAYVRRHLKWLGDEKAPFLYPVTRASARVWLAHFISKKLHAFGTYQDALSYPSRDGYWLFHSGISAPMNIGLIDPRDVIAEAGAWFAHHSEQIAQYEGFVRQVIGWREYERFLYEYEYQTMLASNTFGNDRPLSKTWYLAPAKTPALVEIGPLYDVLDQVWKSAYAHHIQRLMVLLNWMTLDEIRPWDIYSWFMAMTIDAYDWVMMGNVYSMGYAWSGAMRKPYLSSSNYIRTMLPASAPTSALSAASTNWEEIWDDKYYTFLLKHEDILGKTPYARSIGYYKKKLAKE